MLFVYLLPDEVLQFDALDFVVGNSTTKPSTIF
jgi:hypothetical protein